MRAPLTFFFRQIRQIHRVPVTLAVGPDPMNPIHPTPELKKNWEEMRAICDSKESKEHIKQLRASPTFEEDQKKIAERLGELLEAAERSNSFY